MCFGTFTQPFYVFSLFFSSSENDTGSEVVSSQYESTSTVNRAAAAEMNVDGDETGLENEDIMFNSCH